MTRPPKWLAGSDPPAVINSEMGYSVHSCTEGAGLGCIAEVAQASMLSRLWLSDAAAGVHISVWCALVLQCDNRATSMLIFQQYTCDFR